MGDRRKKPKDCLGWVIDKKVFNKKLPNLVES